MRAGPLREKTPIVKPSKIWSEINPPFQEVKRFSALSTTRRGLFVFEKATIDLEKGRDSMATEHVICGPP